MEKWNGNRKNSEGSALSVAVIAMLLLAIALIAVQTSVLSFSARTSVRHYDMQAYLSARSVATALAEDLMEKTEDYILSHSKTVRESLTSLPDSLKLPEANGLAIPQQDIDLIHAFMDMNVGDSIPFGNIAFQDVPSQMKAGTMTATMTRLDVEEYEIAVTVDVEGDVQTVKTILSAKLFNQAGKPPVVVIPPRVEGNASVFYTDYGFGLDPGGSMNNQNGDIPFVSSIAVYLSGISGQFSDKIQSYQDIYFEGMPEKTNGAFVSRSNLSFDNQTMTNIYIHSDQGVAIKSNVKIDGSVANGAGIFADTCYIKGNNIEINVPIYTTQLIIDGNINFGQTEVRADQIQIVAGTNINNGNTNFNCFSTDASVYWVKDAYPDGIPQEEIDKARDPSIDVSDYLQEIKASAGIQTMSENGVGVTGFNKVKVNVSTTTIDPVMISSTGIAPRSMPLWAKLDGLTPKVYDPEEEKLVQLCPADAVDPYDYYVIDQSLLKNDKLVLQWDTFKADGITEANPLRIVVQDGQTLNIKFDANAIDGIYFILQGNAKLNIIKGYVEANIRVYGDAPEASMDRTIRDAVQATVANMTTAGNTPAQIQDAINHLMQVTYIDAYSAVQLLDGAVIRATTVVPYIYSNNGNLAMKAFPYATRQPDLEGGDGGPTIVTPGTESVKMMYVNLHSYRK